MNSQHTKVLSTDQRSKNRIRFSSAKQRGKQATADVYRSWKRNGTTTAADREEKVHNDGSSRRGRKRPRVDEKDGVEEERVFVLKKKEHEKEGDVVLSESDESSVVETTRSNFSDELDLALDRNGSEIFASFHREIWPLARSLPEILHHTDKIVDLLLCYMLSPESSPYEKSISTDCTTSHTGHNSKKDRVRFVANYATTDILHLLAVLAKDLRHEIHGYLHTKILPRILHDLLSPPPLPPNSGKQPIPLDVSIVEAAFRTLSYIFKYDAGPLLEEVEKEGKEPCLEPMRKYYGTVLAHRRDLVRRLAAECFAPLIRKLKTDSAKKRHLRRIMHALVTVSGNQQQQSPATKRMQADAVDGIAQLLFQVSRGVKGRLHSKGNVVVKSVLDNLKTENEGGGSTVVLNIALAFLEHLCHFLESVSASALLNTIIISTNLTIDSCGGREPTQSTHPCSSFLLLINKMVSFEGGILFKDNSLAIEELRGMLEKVMDKSMIHNLDLSGQLAAIELLCSIWRAVPAEDWLVRCLENIGGVLQRTDPESTISLASMLAKDLIPHLPPELGMRTVGSAILSAAAKQSSIEATTSLIHAVVLSTIRAANEEEVDDKDNLFDLSNAAECMVTKSEKLSLLDACLISLDELHFSQTTCAKLVVAVECASFIALVHTSEHNKNDAQVVQFYKRTSQWVFKLMKAIQSDAQYSDGGGSSELSLSVLSSIALHCYTQLSSAILRDLEHATVVRKSIGKVQVFVEKHLKTKSESIWAMKCTAAFVEVLKELGIPLKVDNNLLFELLTRNLRQPNHFLRLHTLEILASLPQLPFVVDHAELDLSGDLDEEPSTNPADGIGIQQKGPSGMCDIMSTLLRIESTPLSMMEERHILSDISRVEVLGRTCRLPVSYAEASASHLLGLLHVKFAPVWPGAVRALVALTAGHESSVWPSVHETIAELTANKTTLTADAKNLLLRPFDGKMDEPLSSHFRKCILWEIPGGSDSSLFRNRQASQDQARASKFESTDSGTVFESSWGIIEKAPQLMTKHSRSMVPIFLKFIQNQYFSSIKDDPDARELQLEQHIEVSEERTLTGEPLNGRDIQKRLISILKAFAAVNGPQQLVNHLLLKSIFVSLLNHREAAISQLAFASLLRFKPQFLVPYADTIEKMFVKGKLRETLIQFKSLLECGDCVSEHRKSMIPVVTRILFGRLAAGAIGKSSKDSPAARRNAVLSFLSILCIDDDDLYPFIYLMVRAYIPRRFSPKPMELQNGEDKTAVLQYLTSLHNDDLAHIQVSVHQGFLNMLEAVISHLGHRVTNFVPAFVSIIISLLKLYEIRDDNGGKSDNAETAKDVKASDDTMDPESPENGGIGTTTIRAGTVRSLCYRRLVQIFDKFHSAVDFTPFIKDMWDSTRKSITLLPEMVINSENVPSLLLLPVSLSSHSDLVKYLDGNQAAVVSVLRCIAPRSGGAPVDSALSFIANLLGESSSEGASRTGPSIITPHIDLLLEQFTSRLDSSGAGAAHVSGTHQTWKQELDILFRVSKLVNNQEDEEKAKSEEGDATTDSLCNLLLPYLTSRRVGDTEQLNVLGTLNCLLPRVGTTRAPFYYSKLSQILGPEKGKSGIESKHIRAAIADVVKSLAEGCYVAAKPVSLVLGQLCAFHSEHLDEIDYDIAVPALSKLNDGDHWKNLSMDSAGSLDPSMLLPLVYTCFFLMYGEDGLIARSAFKATKALIAVVASLSGLSDQSGDNALDSTEKWSKVLHGCILPITRSCLGTKDTSIRRYFVLILREISYHCQTSSSPHLHGDLAQLIREDDPDLDFFLNITHVQVHRRARALQRLRKVLVGRSDEHTEGSKMLFHPQSLSNVLLPLAVHPVYEAKPSTEESLALEAIATVGAIARLLSWSKYNFLLSTTLNQFHRHPEQERFVVGLLCAIIDGFHFDVTGEKCEQGETATAVMRGLENRMIPKVESLLIKEIKDRTGERVKKLRPSIVLALLKLFQKLPETTFKSRLPRLLTIICDILKSRDSNSRDMARSTLAKMVSEMDVSFLADVVRELAITLTEGYQLHVRSATVHSILLSLSSVYKPAQVAAPDSSTVNLAFDRTVPGLMDLLQQDLFGGAQERKEAQDSHVRYVKEAGGSKTYHSLELISSMILFVPSQAAQKTTKPASSVSSVHAIVSPFLERLCEIDVSLSKIRRIRECLSRVVSGLARNPSITTDEVMKFVYATIYPFIGQDQVKNLLGLSSDDDSINEDDEDLPSLKPITVSGQNKPHKAQKAHQMSDKTGKAAVVEWRPSSLGAPASAKAARKTKSSSERDLLKVYDGYSAPKLTGSNRFRTHASSGGNSVNGPASVTAVVFGLQLLNSALKKSSGAWNNENKAMLDPFVPLLTACICFSSELDVVLLGLKCLGLFLRVNLPSFEGCTRPLASKTLDLLTSSGSSSNQHQEIIQASFKMLSFLLDYDRKKVRSDDTKESLPLTPEQMQVLLSFLKTSVVNSDQHSPAITLVKSIMSRMYASAELYDLMETLLEQSVRSSKVSLRLQCSSVFVNYLINYPLSPERVEQHMKQIVSNLKYEYAEGRLSAILLLTSVIDKLPVPVIEQYSQVYFLPLTLQLVNDDSKECREAAANCISSLMRKLSSEPLQSLCDYVLKWSRAEGEVHRTAMQLFGILVNSCPDFLQRNKMFEKLLERTRRTLDNYTDSEWEASYFALIFLEKAWPSFADTLVKESDLWPAVVKSVKSDHMWIRLVSARILTTHLVSLDIDELGNLSSKCFLVRRPGMLHDTARSFCHQLSLLEDEQQTDEIVVTAVKSLTWILRAMNQHPKLCFEEGSSEGNERNPVSWVITRLSNIAKQKVSKRRLAVYKCFAAFATYSADAVESHLEIVLEPLHRTELEAYNELESPAVAVRQHSPAPTKEISEECQLAKDVLHLLEEHCDSQDGFLRAYAAVKSRAQEKKEQRKLEAKAEALTDPKAAAERRIQKQQRERKRRKRRVDERRRSRGGSDSKKRRHVV